MSGRLPLRKGLLLLAVAAVLPACSMQIPNFLGREGTGGDGYYQLRPKPPPEPVAMAIRSATTEQALYGTILRVDGLAPTWGYHSAALRPLSTGPDTNGYLGFQFMAMPPAGPMPVGAPQTREISAAIFVPNISVGKLRGLQVRGVGGQVQTLPLRPR
ncbi:MAG: hypothetical protein U1E59_20475 [Amaricoccus sp.]